jgi:hypothetical protein
MWDSETTVDCGSPGGGEVLHDDRAVTALGLERGMVFQEPLLFHGNIVVIKSHIDKYRDILLTLPAANVRCPMIQMSILFYNVGQKMGGLSQVCGIGARRFIAGVMALAGVTALAACTTVPPLGPMSNTIPINAIVDRINCELTQAITPQIEDYPFLKTWQARANLTLTVNTQSGITPGVSIIDPLAQIVDKARGTFSQSFSVAIGANLNGSANRIEKMSFDIPLANLKATYECAPQGSGLSGPLGLTEWLESAMTVRYAFSSKDVADQFKALDALSGVTRRLKTTVEAYTAQYANAGILLNPAIGHLTNILAKAKAYRQLYGEILAGRDKPLSARELARWQGSLKAAKAGLEGALSSWNPKADCNSAMTDTRCAIQNIIDAAQPGQPNDLNEMDKWVSGTRDAVNRKPEAPREPGVPTLSSLSHQVTFIVVANAGITPSWSLMRLKGPGGAPAGSSAGSSGSSGSGASPSGSFASIARTDTHELLLTFAKDSATLDKQNQLDQQTAPLLKQ